MSGHEMHGMAMPMGNGSSNHSGGDMGGMTMWFHFGYNEDNVLFSFWTIKSIGALVLSMLFIFVASAVFEALKAARVMLMDMAVRRSGYDQTPMLSETSTCRFAARLSPAHLTQAGLYGAQVTLSMMLMLVWMTYNAWLCIAMVAGAIVGYILFGSTPSSNANCNKTDRNGSTVICH